jgi:hypothetical protein
MTAEQFTYWLQGFAELQAAPPSAEQWQAIRDHLALVFSKVTPDRSVRLGTHPVSPVLPQWTNSGPALSPPITTRLVC